jgi:SPP1 family predicted phage head-tail adaptor
MRAGRLNKRISIERITETKNDFGEFVYAWSELAKRSAGIEPLNGKEYFSSVGENSGVTTRIRIRYDSVTATITNADRVNHGGTIYNIVSPPINPQERGAELVLMCEQNGRVS